ncbi:hypothetical protein TREVI0001_0773 [Treponema vincentii ATCC 35580]|uniref:Uncharacterized protein n=1 Tax=Treponema vincentii ATCC 35580 TaxID=596324 RepID=C8PR82_9SPIR|nr:hypothetical protein TREVI0001_0773 [Treponema vincentii ATCC 35580]
MSIKNEKNGQKVLKNLHSYSIIRNGTGSVPQVLISCIYPYERLTADFAAPIYHGTDLF